MAEILVANFEAQNLLGTNEAENSGSLTTACRVLIALLRVPDGTSLYLLQVQSVATRICSTWWARHHEEVKDTMVSYLHLHFC